MAHIVTLKVPDEVDLLIEELIEHRKKVLELVKQFLEKDLPYTDLPTHEDIDESR